MFLEEQISKLQRRVKAIEENPSPVHLRSNGLRYQLELKEYLSVRDAWKAGKPFAVSIGLEPLLRAMGFEVLNYISYGDRVGDLAQHCKESAVRVGISEHTCDRTVAALGLVLNGEVPAPRLVVGMHFVCDPERWSIEVAAKLSGALYFSIDNPLGTNNDSLRCLADQLAGLIEFAEKNVPGIKYDESKLVELLEIERQAWCLIRETYELRKHIPSAISPKDAFRLLQPTSRYANPREALEYYQVYRDELFERAQKGVGGVPEEKLRLAWLATGPFTGKTFDLLERKGCSIPWFHYGAAPRVFGIIPDIYFDEELYGRKLTPLEEMARFPNWDGWAGLAEDWIDPLIQICRDLKIDAVVDFLQAGCVTTKGIRELTAERVKQELGIPVLDLEGRELFHTPAAQMEMDRKLEEFLDLCIQNKRT